MLRYIWKNAENELQRGDCGKICVYSLVTKTGKEETVTKNKKKNKKKIIWSVTTVIVLSYESMTQNLLGLPRFYRLLGQFTKTCTVLSIFQKMLIVNNFEIEHKTYYFWSGLSTPLQKKNTLQPCTSSVACLCSLWMIWTDNKPWFHTCMAHDILSGPQV